MFQCKCEVNVIKTENRIRSLLDIEKRVKGYHFWGEEKN